MSSLSRSDHEGAAGLLNGRGVDLEMPVQIDHHAGLTEMLNAQRNGAVAKDAARPACIEAVGGPDGEDRDMAFVVAKPCRGFNGLAVQDAIRRWRFRIPVLAFCQ